MSNSIFFSALFSFNTASNSFPALDLKPLIFAVLPFVNKATNCESLRVFRRRFAIALNSPHLSKIRLFHLPLQKTITTRAIRSWQAV